VRIKIEIIAGQRRIEETALLNSGYEAPLGSALGTHRHGREVGPMAPREGPSKRSSKRPAGS